MKLLLSLIITLSLVLPASTVLAEQPTETYKKPTEIYKWTDSDGYIHYAARPGDKNAKKLHMGSHRFKKLNSNLDIETKKAQERAQTCKVSKDTLAKYENAPFLYRHDDEKKQKVRLSKEESEKAMLQARKDVVYWCEHTPESKQAEISQNNTE